MSVIQRIDHYIAANSDWWDNLSREQREEYIRQHPRSKYARHARREDALRNLLSRNEVIKTLRPDSPVRKKAAAQFRDNARDVARSMKKIASPEDYRAAVAAARADLKGEKPSKKYRVGMAAAYGAMGVGTGVAAGIIGAGMVMGGAPLAGGAVVVAGFLAELYFYTKGARRLAGFGGKFAAHDAKVKDAAGRRLRDKLPAQAQDVDAMSDEDALAAFHGRLADFLESADLKADDWARVIKVKGADNGDR